MKIMSEFLVFCFDEKYFENILNGIYYDEYNIYSNSNNKDKENDILLIQKNYKKKEKEIKDKSINYSPLTFDNCLLNSKNNKKICLINEDFYRNISKIFNLKYEEKRKINLLKINN